MISVAEALTIVLEHTMLLPSDITPVTSSALGQILATAVASDMDSPPFDKAMMDGYAVRCADCRMVGAELSVIEEIAAGHTPQKIIDESKASRIMTGAPIPIGADAVIPLEQIEEISPNQIRTQQIPKSGQNIVQRGEEMRQGEIVLPVGTALGPQDFGILASVGKTTIQTYPPPRVTILSTGDELVEPMVRPKPGRIRNTNGTMLVAQTIRAKGMPRYLGISRDDPHPLRSFIREGLSTGDILLISGGVSAGKMDHTPGILKELGVQELFHHVNLKPGKPIWFGRLDKKLIFGLPGNPVSSLICFELFVRPAIRKMRGESHPQELLIPLAEDFQYSYDRPTYYPARLEVHLGKQRVRPSKWAGSFDLRSLSQQNALLVISSGVKHLSAGSEIPTILLGD